MLFFQCQYLLLLQRDVLNAFCCTIEIPAIVNLIGAEGAFFGDDGGLLLIIRSILSRDFFKKAIGQ